jgi:signal transduction histidine kinase
MQITSNEDAITRIVDNLISNAGKYNTSHGSVTLTIDPDVQQLAISDTGKGIHHPEKVFDRFYKEHERGLGIGLHIVKKLCDQLSIPIKVESTLGKGSRFLLDLHRLTQH